MRTVYDYNKGMRKIIILILAVLMLPVMSQAQKWKRQRVEYSFGVGATNFLGDLGGRNQQGTDGLMDFEIKATRYAAGFGYRYQWDGRDQMGLPVTTGTYWALPGDSNATAPARIVLIR